MPHVFNGGLFDHGFEVFQGILSIHPHCPVPFKKLVYGQADIFNRIGTGCHRQTLVNYSLHGLINLRLGHPGYFTYFIGTDIRVLYQSNIRLGIV